jgi:hypothetical protein
MRPLKHIVILFTHQRDTGHQSLAPWSSQAGYREERHVDNATMNSLGPTDSKLVRYEELLALGPYARADKEVKNVCLTSSQSALPMISIHLQHITLLLTMQQIPPCMQDGFLH